MKKPSLLLIHLAYRSFWSSLLSLNLPLPVNMKVSNITSPVYLLKDLIAQWKAITLLQKKNLQSMYSSVCYFSFQEQEQQQLEANWIVLTYSSGWRKTLIWEWNVVHINILSISLAISFLGLAVWANHGLEGRKWSTEPPTPSHHSPLRAVPFSLPPQNSS